MTEAQAKKKIASLVALAKRPGTPAEGKIAKQTAIRLAKKYNVPCEFVKVDTFKRFFDDIVKSAEKKPSKTKKASEDWIQALKDRGWKIVREFNTPKAAAHEIHLNRGQSEIWYRQYEDGEIPDKEAQYVANIHMIGVPGTFIRLEDLLKATEKKPGRVDIEAEKKRDAEAFKKAYTRY